jgi:RNA polymerase sigma-54 factor
MNITHSILPLQQLKYSFDVQLSLQILQLPIVELEEWLKSEIENNPLLEYTKNKKDSMLPFLDNVPSPHRSLFEHLMEQARECFLSEKELQIAETIIGNLDDKGFITVSLETFSEDTHLINSVLKTIQHFDPPGIAAHNLRHSFLIQLENLGKRESLAYRIIDQHYDELLHNKLLALSQKTGRSLKDVKKAIQEEIKSLQLNPGYAFHHQTTQHVIPDLMMQDDTIQVNEAPLPTFRLISHQASENPHLQPYSQAAHSLIKALDRRKKTLQKIGDYLYNHQKKFLTHITNYKEPSTLKELSQYLQLHESTISRAIKDKYLFCSRGLLPLRDFFSQETPNLKEKLTEIVQKENKKEPYSDEALAKQLKQIGIPCARRTIAKYRQSLNIPHASLRRQW